MMITYNNSPATLPMPLIVSFSSVTQVKVTAPVAWPLPPTLTLTWSLPDWPRPTVQVISESVVEVMLQGTPQISTSLSLVDEPSKPEPWIVTLEPDAPNDEVETKLNITL